MTSWKRISTAQAREYYKLTSSNCRSGYRTTHNPLGGQEHKFYWSYPAGYYGIERNSRTTMVGGPQNPVSSGTDGGPDVDHVPTTFSYFRPWDGMVPYDVTIKSGHKTHVHWCTSGGGSPQMPGNDECRYFLAPIFVSKEHNKFWESHNNSFISLNNCSMPLGNWGGTASQEGIMCMDVGTTNYSNNDQTYNFGFEFTHTGDDIKISRGTYYLLLVTNDTATSSQEAEYLRDFTVIQEWERS